MANGKVKWFNDSKGFGFITADDGTDAFVHHGDIEGEGCKSLAEGEKIPLEIAPEFAVAVGLGMRFENDIN